MSTTATFTVGLKDQVSGPASAGAGALAVLKAEMTKGLAAVKQLQAAHARLKAGGLGSSAAARQLRDQLAAQRSAVAQAQSGIVALGGAMEETKPPTSALGGFLDVARKTPGPIGAIAGKLGELKAAGPALALFAVGAVGAIAFAAAAISAAAAVVRLTIALTEYGIASANARRNEELHLEGLTRLRRHSTYAAMSSGELMGAIDRVSGFAAIGRSEVAGYAEQLYRAGVRGTALDVALEGVAISAAAGGDAAGRRFLGMAAGAARAGRSVRALTDEVRGRLGSVNARMNLDLGRQADRLRESFAALFGGSRVAAALERFLASIGQIQDLFSQSSASGRALRQIVEAIFPNALDSVSELAPLAREVFQRMMIGALRATIGLVTLRRGLRGVWNELTGGLGYLQAVRAAINGIDLALQSPLAWFMVVGRAIELWWHDIGASAASSLIDGLVGGVSARAAAVSGAMRGLASNVASTFRDALGIHSPSRVFLEYGRHVAGGLAAGVEAGTPEADRAIGGMVEIPSGGGPSSASSSRSVSIGELHVHSQATDAAGIAQDIRDQLASVLEGLVLEMGAPA